jgi:hypothetical protein
MEGDALVSGTSVSGADDRSTGTVVELDRRWAGTVALASPRAAGYQKALERLWFG